MRRIVRSFGYAFEGLATIVRTQPNFWVHVAAAVAALVLGVVLRLSAVELALIVLSIGLVLVVESVNTAIETMCDLVSPGHHPLIKRAKDISAASVLIAALAAVVVGAAAVCPAALACTWLDPITYTPCWGVLACLRASCSPCWRPAPGRARQPLARHAPARAAATPTPSPNPATVALDVVAAENRRSALAAARSDQPRSSRGRETPTPYATVEAAWKYVVDRVRRRESLGQPAPGGHRRR